MSHSSLTCLAVLVLVSTSCGVSELELGAEDEVLISTQEAELRTNTDPGRVVVYSNNVENMLFDWKDLIHDMAEDELRPDIFLVQQITSRDELNRMTGFMSRRLGVAYEGLVAQNQPDDQRFQNQIQPRPTVTTGIIFRSRRFELVNRDSWMPFGHGFSGQVQTCDQRSNHSGYETLRLNLFDKLAKKNVVVVSLRHWTWHPCSTKNILEIVNGRDGAHAGLGKAALQIVGGDFNEDLLDGSGDYKCWYRQVNRNVSEAACAQDINLGFTDPMFAFCNGEKSCVRQQNGIDHIFVRRGDGKPVRTNHFDAISFDEAHRASAQGTGGDGLSNVRSRDGYNDVGPNYSQHRARRAYVFYE